MHAGLPSLNPTVFRVVRCSIADARDPASSRLNPRSGPHALESVDEFDILEPS
jgi:hypothetical protein